MITLVSDSPSFRPLLSIDLLIHHKSIIADLQNYVNTLSKMILHIQASIYAFFANPDFWVSKSSVQG